MPHDNIPSIVRHNYFKLRYMIRRTRKCESDLNKPSSLLLAVTILTFIIVNVTQAFAQDTILADFSISVPETKDAARTLFGGKITNSGYGGPAIKFSRFNNQFAFMTGGRGSITINNRYTIGGGGYGVANSIEIPGLSEDTSRLFKMGYGGIELGYIFLPAKKVNFGASLLIAGGAAFWQNKPKSNGEKLFNDDINLFPVFESSLYGEISLNQFMRLHAGISYRYVHNTHLGYISDQNIRGFSFYLGLLFGK
jgi:hypothetical protein